MQSKEDLLAKLRKGSAVTERNLYTLTEVMIDTRDVLVGGFQALGGQLSDIFDKLKAINKNLKDIEELLKP